jgi:hypothetical protein
VPVDCSTHMKYCFIIKAHSVQVLFNVGKHLRSKLLYWIMIFVCCVLDRQKLICMQFQSPAQNIMKTSSQ